MHLCKSGHLLSFEWIRSVNNAFGQSILQLLKCIVITTKYLNSVCKFEPAGYSFNAGYASISWLRCQRFDKSANA